MFFLRITLLAGLLVSGSAFAMGDKGGSHDSDDSESRFFADSGYDADVSSLAEDPNERDEKGRAVLHRLARSGEVKLLKAHLTTNPDLDLKTVRHGWSALHIASKLEHKDVVVALLDAKANVLTRTRSGKSVLDVTKSEEIRQILCDFADETCRLCCVCFLNELEKSGIRSFSCKEGRKHTEKVCEECLLGLKTCAVCRGLLDKNVQLHRRRKKRRRRHHQRTTSLVQGACGVQ